MNVGFYHGRAGLHKEYPHSNSVVWNKTWPTDYDAPLDLEYSPREASWADIGGPAEATIEARGAFASMQSLVDQLGKGIDIFGDRGEVVWHGIVDRVTIRDGQYEHVFSLDRMVNSVAITYHQISGSADTTGTKTKSAWETDGASVTKYGVMQSLIGRAKLTLAEAQAVAAQVLNQSSNPNYSFQLNRSTLSAEIFARGVWYYLQREYYLNDFGRIQNVTGRNYAQNFGEGSGIAEVAQRIGNALVGGTPADFDAAQVTVQLARVPDATDSSKPNDTVVCEICADDWVLAAQIKGKHDLGSPNTFSPDVVETGSTHWRFGVLVNGNYAPEWTNWQNAHWFAYGDVLKATNALYGQTEYITIKESYTPGAFPAAYGAIYRVERGSPARTFNEGWPPMDKVYRPGPGTVLATSTPISAENIPTQMSEVTFTFPSPITLVDGTAYWIKIRRTATRDTFDNWSGDGYYQLGGSTEGGHDVAGVPSYSIVRFMGWKNQVIYNGDAAIGQNNGSFAYDVWRHCIPAEYATEKGRATIWFKVFDTEDTTAQIAKMAEASQFLVGAQVETTSGISTAVHRDGSKTIQDEIKRMLDRGSSNTLPLLAQVTRGRRLRVFEEPRTTALYWLSDGKLGYEDGTTIDMLPPPVGQYVFANAWRQGGQVQASGAMYVKDAVYTFADRRLEFRGRDSVGYMQIPTVEEG